MKLVQLTKGFVATVSDQDFSRVQEFKWTAIVAKHTVYAYRQYQNRSIYLHRFIKSARPGEEVDHRDGNGLNNCRRNLRIASHQQNAFARWHNTKKKKRTSQFRGVSFCWATGKWRARLIKNYCEVWLGRFDSQQEAAHAYNIAARHYFKSFASPNGTR